LTHQQIGSDGRDERFDREETVEITDIDLYFDVDDMPENR
jgi:hypothetical protein